MILVSGLSFRYAARSQPALRDISFSLGRGRVLLVLGPSGSGKSTLGLCLDGLIPHLVEGDYAGEVRVGGLVVRDTAVPVLAQNAGVVFQDPEAQFCTLTVEDEVAFGLENLCVPPEDIEAAIDKSLAMVGLSGFRSRRLSSLSGGEKQRVALAAVLAMDPQILVLDEPSANLDPQSTGELFQAVRRLAKERQRTIVIIEHKLDELVDWVDEVLVLGREGKLLARGTPQQVFYEHGQSLAEAGVWRPQTVELVEGLRKHGWAVPGHPLTMEETVTALLDTPGLTERLRASSAASCGSFRTRSLLGGNDLLRVDRLSYRYPDSPPGAGALDSVSLRLARGEMLAVAGASGAGKTTLVSLLSGVLKPPRDRVYLAGKDLSQFPLTLLAEQVGHVFQNPEHQFVSDTVRGELVFSLDPRRGPRGACHLSLEQQKTVDTWLERLGLADLAEANPFSLSQGQKRRLSVAAMLIRARALLVLDEPTLGQDEAQTEMLLDLLEGFRSSGGAVIMVTHDMRLVAEHADRLLVLGRGRDLYFGVPRGFFGQADLVSRSGLGYPPVGRISALVHEELGLAGNTFTLGEFLAWAGSGGDCP